MGWRWPFAFLAVTSAACAIVADIPETVTVNPCPTPIRVRFVNPLYDPTVADVALPFYLGTTDHLREIQAQGGIRGCRVEYSSTETTYADPAKVAAIYEGWKKEKDWNEVVAIFGVSSADALELGPRAGADKRIYISTAYNGTLATPRKTKGDVKVPSSTFVPDEADSTKGTERTTTSEEDVSSNGFPYVFFPGTDYSTAIRAALFYVAGHDVPGTVVGWAHCAQDPFCLDPLKAGKSYAGEQKLVVGRDLLVELVPDPVAYGAAVSAYFANEAKLENANTKPATWLWAGNLTAGTFLLASAIEKLATEGPSDQIKRLAGATKIIANNWGFDEGLVALCPKNPAACKRILGVMPFAAFGDTRASAMREVVRLHDKYRELEKTEGGAPKVIGVGGVPPPTRSVRYVQGYMNVELLRLAIDRTIARGEQVNGPNLKATLEKFSGESTGGLTEALGFSALDHRPQSTIAVYSIDVPEAAAPSLKFETIRDVTLKDPWLGW